MGLVTAHWLAVLLDMDSKRRMLKSVSISPDSNAGSRERWPFKTCIAGVSLEAFLKWYVARWSMVAAHCDANGASSPCLFFYFFSDGDERTAVRNSSSSSSRHCNSQFILYEHAGGGGISRYI